MSSEIRAGVRLSLNDQFSPSIKRAGLSAQGFRDKAVGAAEAVNKAFSGLSGTLATVGVGLGAAALVREGIGFQDAVTRIATSAGKFGDEASEFGKRLLRVAVESGVSKNELLAFAQVAADGGVLLEDIAEPLPFMADMIQGIGLSGAEAGDLLGVFFSRGANADALVEKMSEIVAIFGELGNVGVPKFVRYVRSLLEESGTAGVDGIVDMFVAMNMLATGTNNASQAHYQLRSALRDLGDADVQRAIRGWTGFEVGADGGIKSFLDAARELSEFAERRGIGNFENFEAAFGFSEATIRALSQYGNHFDSTVARIADLGDTSDAVARRAERNAATIQSSLNRLGAAALDFANSTLMGPIERLAMLLNENPDGMKRAVQGVAGALAVKNRPLAKGDRDKPAQPAAAPSGKGRLRNPRNVRPRETGMGCLDGCQQFVWQHAGFGFRLRQVRLHKQEAGQQKGGVHCGLCDTVAEGADRMLRRPADNREPGYA